VFMGRGSRSSMMACIYMIDRKDSMESSIYHNSKGSNSMACSMLVSTMVVVLVEGTCIYSLGNRVGLSLSSKILEHILVQLVVPYRVPHWVLGNRTIH